MKLSKPQLREFAADLSASGGENKLCELAEFARNQLAAGGYLATYCAFGDEVDTSAVSAELSKVVFPAITGQSNSMIWRQGLPNTRSELGFKQPSAASKEVPITDIGLVLVPGLLFTPYGARLGRGGGYYDRFLSQLPPATPTVGMVISARHLVDSLPVEAHDVAVTHLCVDGDLRVVESQE